MRTPSLCVCNAKVLSTSICNALNSLYKRILVRITDAYTLNILPRLVIDKRREVVDGYLFILVAYLNIVDEQGHTDGDVTKDRDGSFAIFTLEPKYDLYLTDIQLYNNGNSMN